MFYDQLLGLSKENNVKITNVVKELKLSTSGISRWQKGVLPNGETLIKFSNYFNVPIDYLLEDELKLYNSNTAIKLTEHV